MAELSGLICEQCADQPTYLPPLFQCPSCGSTSLAERMLSGRGTVYSFTRVEVGAGKFAGRVPFVIALVDLEEGPRTAVHVTHPRAADHCQVEVGNRVVFDHHDDLEVPIFHVVE